MKDSPVSTLEEKKNRRGVLALIGAGGAAAVAALLGRSNGAQAADNDPVLVGNSHTGSSTTSLTSSSADPVLQATSTAGGNGLLGHSIAGDGVQGSSGFMGASGGRGVHGLGRWGVLGEGIGSGSVGVKGEASTGKVGTWGYASGAAKEGMRATGAGGAVALSVQGRALFSNAGTTIMNTGEKVKLVTIGGEISPNAMILGTLQEWPGNFVCVRYCGRVSANSFYIVLTGEPARNVKVGYMIIG